MTTGNRIIVAAIVVALAQIGFLGWLIAGRAAILRDGREIVLKVEPVDPHDLLRGDYVRLGYEISSIPVSKITNVAPDKTWSDASDIYVRVKKGADGYWHLLSATFDAPSPAALQPDEADIKGSIEAGWDLGPGTSIDPEYGIGRFYLPEGEGMDLEKDMRVRPFGIRLALAGDGTAQIKALLDADTMLFQEPLY
jgi:uncharacterized membrane-anchored protein